MPSKVKKSEFIGDGPVKYRLDGLPGESTATISLVIDYTEVPVPKFYYVADYFYVENLDSSMLLVFGKVDNLKKRERLRTKLEVYFSVMPFVMHLWKSSREFHKTLRTAVERYNFEPENPGSSVIDAEKTQTIQANNVLMALSGSDSLLDFYYLSPRELSIKTKKKRLDIELEPLARVILSPPMLLGFLDACEDALPSLQRFLIEEQEEDHDSLESH